MSRQIHPIPVEAPLNPSVRGLLLRNTRRLADISRAELSIALEVSVPEVIGIEMGRYILSDADWLVAFDEVRKLGRVSV